MQIASRSERMLASLIDGMVFLPIMLLDDAIPSMTQSQMVIFFYFLVSWQLGWLYSTILHSYSGQTLGKKFEKIKVVRIKELTEISFGRAVVRDLPIIVPVLVSTSVWIHSHIAWLGGWYSERHETVMQEVYNVAFYCYLGWAFLELISMLFHPQRRAIHDLIAGTIVVKVPKLVGMPEPLDSMGSEKIA